MLQRALRSTASQNADRGASSSPMHCDTPANESKALPSSIFRAAHFMTAEPRKGREGSVVSQALGGAHELRRFRGRERAGRDTRRH